MKSLKILELFAGIGACSKAIENLNIPYEIVDAVEIDKYAITSFNAIHGTNFEPQDITKWDKDFEDMRGTMCFEMARIIKKIKPKYFLFENVEGLLSHDKGKTIRIILEEFGKLGYEITMDCLNAKDYGIPQNRSRIYCIGRRIDE